MAYDKKVRGYGATFDRFLEKIKATSNIILIILLLGLTLLLGISIAMRFFLGQPISWSNAVARYIYIYIVMIGTAISYMLDGHASIESFHNIMPSKIRLTFDLAHYIIMMSLSAILVVKGIKYAVSMWGVHSPVLSFFSMGIIYLAVPICFSIIFLYLLRKLIRLPGEYRS